MKLDEDIVLIAGPTASGKTSLAISIAKANDAIILNADSMQVYSELRVLSARPDDEELTAAPHHLFGHIKGDQAYSVAHWLEDVKPYLEAHNRKLVFVGGTGLYFNALLEGLSPIPEIEQGIREEWRDTVLSTESLYQALKACDPKAAEPLRSNDRQRIIRALEVFHSTGKSILEWQNVKGKSLIGEGLAVRKFLLMPERPILHERINQRFDLMIEQGALEEVIALLALDYPQSASVMKAIGVPQLSAYIRGEFTLDEAIEKSKAATRQYAKRQSTWFRNSFGEGWEVL